MYEYESDEFHAVVAIVCIDVAAVYWTKLLRQ